jgi:hypothetical protein
MRINLHIEPNYCFIYGLMIQAFISYLLSVFHLITLSVGQQLTVSILLTIVFFFYMIVRQTFTKTFLGMVVQAGGSGLFAYKEILTLTPEHQLALAISYLALLIVIYVKPEEIIQWLVTTFGRR